MIKDPPASAGDIRDVGLIPGSGRSPEAPRFSILAWRSHGHRSLVHRVEESRTQLKRLSTRSGQ